MFLDSLLASKMFYYASIGPSFLLVVFLERVRKQTKYKNFKKYLWLLHSTIKVQEWNFRSTLLKLKNVALLDSFRDASNKTLAFKSYFFTETSIKQPIKESY